MESSSTEILFQPTPVAERQEASEWAGVAVELLGFFEKKKRKCGPTIPHPIWIPPTVDAWAAQDGTKPSRSSSNEHRSVTRSKSIKGLPGKSQNA